MEESIDTTAQWEDHLSHIYNKVHEMRDMLTIYFQGNNKAIIVDIFKKGMQSKIL